MNFAGALQILFIAFKLANYITWSWWWVMSPTWFPFSLFIFFYCLAEFYKHQALKNETEGQKLARLVREYSEAVSKEYRK